MPTHKQSAKPFLYALSTCVWCRRTKTLLDELKVDYDFIYTDELSGPEKDAVVKALEEVNPARSFPTLVLGPGKCIIGFKEEELRKELTKCLKK